MKAVGLLAILIGLQAFAADPLYQVSYFSKEKSGDYIQSYLADWGAEDLGPAPFYSPIQGSRYFYFQLDQEVVEDLFHDLSLKGDVFIERTENKKRVPNGKAHFVVWFFPDRGDSGQKSKFEWSKGSSKAGKRKDEVQAKFDSLGLQTKSSTKWRNTFSFGANSQKYLEAVDSGEFLNGNLLVQPKVTDTKDETSVLVTVRDVKAQDGEAIEEKTPTKKIEAGFDLDFRLLPALPLEPADMSELETALGSLGAKLNERNANDFDSLEVEGPSDKFVKILERVGEYGLLRLVGQSSEKLSTKKALRIRFLIQENDDVMKQSIEVPETVVNQIQDKYKNEVDLLYSGSSGSSGKWISAVDVTMRKWFGRYGLRANYVETAGAPGTDYSQLLGVHFQYRLHWKKARYGQSIIPGLVYKQIRSAGPVGQLYGAGVAYTDDMWKSVAWLFDLVPFLRRPKTVEMNIEYLPLKTSAAISSPSAFIFSLKGYVHQSQRLKWIGGLYYHNFQYVSDEFSGGVKIASSTVTNSLTSIQFGMGLRF